MMALGGPKQSTACQVRLATMTQKWRGKATGRDVIVLHMGRVNTLFRYVLSGCEHSIPTGQFKGAFEPVKGEAE
jgi:hypothetical protein